MNYEKGQVKNEVQVVLLENGYGSPVDARLLWRRRDSGKGHIGKRDGIKKLKADLNRRRECGESMA